MNMQEIQKQFPILKVKIHGKRLAYLDNGATSQKPQRVIDAVTNYYQGYNANVHRGVHWLSETASDEYEKAREKVAKFINAKSAKEIIFTKNATESINLLAATIGEKHLKKGDEIIVSALEHHANLIPWQQIAKAKKVNLKIAELTKEGGINYEDLAAKTTEKTKVIAVTGQSNVTGYKTNLEKVVEIAKSVSALTVVDASQLVVHHKCDVQALDIDCLALTGHKIYGPTGVGVVYGKLELLEELPPFLTGGGMINLVEDTHSTFAEVPEKFEAGTPNIAQAIGLGEAIDFINEVGIENIKAHEEKLTNLTREIFSKYEEVEIQTHPNSSGIFSFTLKCAHPHDIASIFDQFGVAIRAGHHCCQPLMRRIWQPSTARISFAAYNCEEDIYQAEEALKKTIEIFK
jgi:cysteine desulfurase/selenocysteine lyase